MTEGTMSTTGARRHVVRCGVALASSLLLSSLLLLSISPVGASVAGRGGKAQILPPGRDTTTTTEETTTSSSTTTPTTRPPQTTRPPETVPETTAPPPVEEDPPETEPEPVEEEEQEEEVVDPARATSGVGPIVTTRNLLVGGNGIAGSESEMAQAPQDEVVEAGSSSDEDRVIWMIIAGLAAVALLVALLTWRYWLLTRPGLDLSEDDADDGAYDDGPYGGPDAARAPGDPYAAGALPPPAPGPMTAGVPSPPPGDGWPEPRAGGARQRSGRLPGRPPRDDRAMPPEPPPRGARRSRGAPGPDADPFPPTGVPAPPPQGGRGGRGRRGADPFWDDAGDRSPRRQPAGPPPGPPPARGDGGQPRRPSERRGVRDTDAWGRRPRD